MKNTFTIIFFALFMVGLCAQEPDNINVVEVGNYKMAEPPGFGEAHYIERSKDITYTIFFQNNSQDTVYNLRVVDTLSSHLDISTLRQEGASHAYNMTVLGGNTVRFSFPNIRLPNSATNEPTSMGFVKFTISQKENLPLMTVIPNTATIYFDFSPPVYTNTVFHTIGAGTTLVNQNYWPRLSLHVYPNPMEEKATFDIKGASFKYGELHLFSSLGQVVYSKIFSNSHFIVNPLQLPAGYYFYKITLDGLPAATGKLEAR